MTPIEYCQQKTAQSGSSFYYSFLFLSVQRRQAITALYAFCREVDDVVDESSNDNVAKITLDWWRKEVHALSNRQPTHPITQALLPYVEAYSVEPQYLLAIIDGMEMDFQQSRYLDFEDLQNYCWHVASVVGILSARIFGEFNQDVQNYAEKLGLAFQLTNIIRDVGEDARRRRIYLPIDELQQFDVKAADILAFRHTPNFESLMHFQVQRANRIYDEALGLLPSSMRRAQRPGLIMAALYRSLLNEIEKDGFHVLNQRISLTPIRKFWLAWKTWVFF